MGLTQSQKLAHEVVQVHIRRPNFHPFSDVEILNMVDKIKEARLRWSRHVKRRCTDALMRSCEGLEIWTWWEVEVGRRSTKDSWLGMTCLIFNLLRIWPERGGYRSRRLGRRLVYSTTLSHFLRDKLGVSVEHHVCRITNFILVVSCSLIFVSYYFINVTIL